MREVSLITSWDDFLELGEEWQSLLQRSDADPLFMSWDWFESWASIWRSALSPYVVVVRQDGRLTGIAPLYLSTIKLFQLMPYRTLRLMTDLNSGSEYGDFLVETDAGLEIRQEILEFIANASGWDCLYMTQLRGWDDRPLMKAISLVRGLGYRCRDRPFASMSLPTSVGALSAEYSSNLKKNLRRFENRLAGSETLFVKCESEADLESALETLFDLHEKRWQALGESGSFERKPGLKAFYQEFTRRALKQGRLWLTELRVDGIPRAVQLGYQVDDCFYVIQEGFDPAFKQGIGNLLREWVLQRCIESGVRVYDFLAGESEHKRRWGAQLRSGYDLLAFRKTFKTLPLISRGFPGGRMLELANHQLANSH